ncbi:MAG: prepilin peptidase, partial [Lachnospiraceae bacterium]|nr:prepilin peptidase [Lachnospiraceae bacterium]
VSGIVLLFLIFIMGSMIFSFLNVVIYRLPRNENFITGRSKCPICGHELTYLDMVPILSWLALKKKCRYCGTKISGRYALVEALGGMAAVGCTWVYGFTWHTLLSFAMCGVLACVAFIDYDTMTIPNGLCIAAAILGFLSIFLTDYCTWYEHLFGMFAVSLPMLLIAMAVPAGFGGGDIKLMIGCGLYLGWMNAIVAFLSAVVLGGIWAVCLLAAKKKNRKDTIPFGPSLCIGTAFAMFGGHFLVSWYVSLL